MRYDKTKIEWIVRRIIDAVNHNRYTISKINRQKNEEFRAKHGINTEQRLKDILLQLTVDNFSCIAKNVNPGYEEEQLYIFGPQVQVYRAGEDTATDVIMYIKVSIIERNIDDFIVVISFHEAEKVIRYAFK